MEEDPYVAMDQPCFTVPVVKNEEARQQQEAHYASESTSSYCFYSSKYASAEDVEETSDQSEDETYFILSMIISMIHPLKCQNGSTHHLV